jgi:hypothetical protein
MVTRNGTDHCGDSGGRVTAECAEGNQRRRRTVNQFPDICIQEEIRIIKKKEN